MTQRVLAYWLPLSCAICGLFIFSYWGVQQNYRQNVNDPQIQIAEDTAAQLAAGASLTHHQQPTDIATSLDTWIAVYDASGNAIDSTAVLNGSAPKLPQGVFDTSTWRPLKHWQAPTGPETRFSWQPQANVRQAVVLVQFQTKGGVGYVAAGRSMRLIEERITDFTHGAGAAWGITEFATLVVIYIILALGWI